MHRIVHESASSQNCRLIGRRRVILMFAVHSSPSVLCVRSRSLNDAIDPRSSDVVGRCSVVSAGHSGLGRLRSFARIGIDRVIRRTIAMQVHTQPGIRVDPQHARVRERTAGSGSLVAFSISSKNSPGFVTSAGPSAICSMKASFWATVHEGLKHDAPHATVRVGKQIMAKRNIRHSASRTRRPRVLQTTRSTVGTVSAPPP